ncbi:Non-specific serine/threonine protein kinase protein [Dioscorea alata]|uniref:Non-specific serine/threonine protein kinase protein n=2 Tax=Dioscorea alata TaxID=55571 RepID=A0ACB7UDT5_DIOAL|nr:Non-specific serine/threonine protein kinase protein [Dioscorea alata]KAH7658439.1 Non-specific serine/threonine protein kinase protein [Dioscorea alata]
MNSCKPLSCGQLQNISYPFWLSGKHPSYCGYPSFKVSCQNNMSILSMSDSFQILNIFYENQSVVLNDTKLDTSKCSFPNSDLSFGLSMFEISSVNRELSFFFCNSSHLSPDSVRVPCQPLNISAQLSDDNWVDAKPKPSLRSCHVARRPVLGCAGAKSSDYAVLLRRGFLLKWNVADCTECKQSNGECGYSEERESFTCLCDDHAHLRHCKYEKKKRKQRIELITIGVSAGTGASLVVFGFLFWYKRWKRNKKSTITLGRSYSAESSSMREDTGYTSIFSYRELQEATDNFSESKELGDGGFGTVYKGILQDGRTVAIKRLYGNNYKRAEQFMNEVAILSRLRHQNLVSLYGSTSRHSRELLLVYEFIPNGTVADHLHGHLSHSSPLPWPIRLNIAIQTATALTYLHAIQPPIIHRDVKTTNILLDQNFNVKVADFGLSRLVPVDATHVSTAPQGTPGYLDPVYYRCYRLTDKSDVYSFGVVLMELISSKPAVDVRRSEINLASMAVDKMQRNELEEFVDWRIWRLGVCKGRGI